jgi:Protein of unknown function (DUF3277)
MAILKTYSPEKVIVNVAGTNIHGFAEDSIVSVVRNVDAFSTKVGADGEVGRSHNPDRTGTITITLKSDSDSNDFLSALAIADDVSLAGVFPILVEDANGTSLHSCDAAWIQKSADAEYNREMSEREWVIYCSQLNHFVGGSL